MPMSKSASRISPTQTDQALDRLALVDLYQVMFRIREAERRISEIYPSDKIQSPVHLSIGQEAVSAGVCRAMRPGDHLYGTYRSHGLFIAKGGDLKKLFAELYGRRTGCAKGKGGSMHVAAPEAGLMGCSAIVASLIPVATGDALASEMQGRSRVVVSFFGDGAVDEGVFFESVNFALLKKLPILYVCENNHYAVHSKISDRHRQTELFRLTEGLGLTGKRYDGDDAALVFARTREALEEIREGGGPMLLEFMTHRWIEHVGPRMDLEDVYREKGEARLALESDPLPKTKTLLQTQFGIPESVIQEWEDLVRREVDEAVAYAEKSPFPDPGELWEDLYEGRA